MLVGEAGDEDFEEGIAKDETAENRDTDLSVKEPGAPECCEFKSRAQANEDVAPEQAQPHPSKR